MSLTPATKYISFKYPELIYDTPDDTPDDTLIAAFVINDNKIAVGVFKDDVYKLVEPIDLKIFNLEYIPRVITNGEDLYMSIDCYKECGITNHELENLNNIQNDYFIFYDKDGCYLKIKTSHYDEFVSINRKISIYNSILDNIVEKNDVIDKLHNLKNETDNKLLKLKDDDFAKIGKIEYDNMYKSICKYLSSLQELDEYCNFLKNDKRDEIYKSFKDTLNHLKSKCSSDGFNKLFIRKCSNTIDHNKDNIITDMHIMYDNIKSTMSKEKFSKKDIERKIKNVSNDYLKYTDKLQSIIDGVSSVESMSNAKNVMKEFTKTITKIMSILTRVLKETIDSEKNNMYKCSSERDTGKSYDDFVYISDKINYIVNIVRKFQIIDIDIDVDDQHNNDNGNIISSIIDINNVFHNILIIFEKLDALFEETPASLQIVDYYMKQKTEFIKYAKFVNLDAFTNSEYMELLKSSSTAHKVSNAFFNDVKDIVNYCVVSKNYIIGLSEAIRDILYKLYYKLDLYVRVRPLIGTEQSLLKANINVEEHPINNINITSEDNIYQTSRLKRVFDDKHSNSEIMSVICDGMVSTFYSIIGTPKSGKGYLLYGNSNINGMVHDIISSHDVVNVEIHNMFELYGEYSYDDCNYSGKIVNLIGNIPFLNKLSVDSITDFTSFHNNLFEPNNVNAERDVYNIFNSTNKYRKLHNRIVTVNNVDTSLSSLFIIFKLTLHNDTHVYISFAEFSDAFNLKDYQHNNLFATEALRHLHHWQTGKCGRCEKCPLNEESSIDIENNILIYPIMKYINSLDESANKMIIMINQEQSYANDNIMLLDMLC